MTDEPDSMTVREMIELLERQARAHGDDTPIAHGDIPRLEYAEFWSDRPRVTYADGRIVIHQ